MTSIYLRHEGPVPSELAGAWTEQRRREFAFSSTPGYCGRCNRDLSEHRWQIVDPDEPEQGGVLDCAVEL